MRSFLNKAKTKLDDVKQQRLPQVDGAAERPSSIHPPTPTDVTRYRYHHGTNLGSVFVLERWLTGSMFRDDFQGSSELASAEGWTKREGIEKARRRFEKHWKDYCSDANLDWLKHNSGCTTIRLPIGYWTLGPAYCDGTPFRSVAPIYEHAWTAVKDVIKRCHDRGMGVLLDLHGLPGGANKGDHSGTNSGKAEFWDSRKNRNLATRCLCFIAQQVKSMDGVVGIQVVNESEYNAPHMYEWYDEVHKELSGIDSSMPLYVSDGWDLGRCAEWARKKNIVGNASSPVVVDTHLYWAYTDEDHNKSPQQITGEVSSKLSENKLKDGSVTDRGAAQVIIGEYSCALNPSSWSKAGSEKSREDLIREFGNAESWRYQQRAGGSFFWTYLMDWMPGGDWGFKHLTEQNAIVRPKSLMVETGDVQPRVQKAHSERDHLRGTTWGSHCQYWDSNHPGHYEHDRFAQGWDVGFSDAMAFYEMRDKHQHTPGGDKIGMLDLWILKRLRESGQSGKFVWEWEQGMRQGVRDFYEAAGI